MLLEKKTTKELHAIYLHNPQASTRLFESWHSCGVPILPHIHSTSSILQITSFFHHVERKVCLRKDYVMLLFWQTATEPDISPNETVQ